MGADQPLVGSTRKPVEAIQGAKDVANLIFHGFALPGAVGMDAEDRHDFIQKGELAASGVADVQDPIISRKLETHSGNCKGGSLRNIKAEQFGTKFCTSTSANSNDGRVPARGVQSVSRPSSRSSCTR